MRSLRLCLWIGIPAVLAGTVVAVLLFQKTVPSRTILELNLETEVVDFVPADPVTRMLLAKVPRLRDLVDALERAREDERVVGLVAKVGAVQMGIGTMQEIRDAILRFREKGKFAVAFSETFGEFGPGNTAYTLATAFDEIRLEPSGDVGLTGLRLETPFLKGTLDKVGAKFQGDHRHEYKSALEMFTRQKYTAAHRESMEALKESIFGQMLRAIASGRKIPAARLRTLVDRGPLAAEEALQARLVDTLAYRDETWEEVKRRGGEGARLLCWDQYLKLAGRPQARGPRIALVYAAGAVTRGKSRFNPFGGSLTLGSDTVSAALRKAARDKDVKAIVLRVNSPGGSYVASDAIYRETIRAREAGKPVVVSMGDVAASGGYFISIGADKIVAQPGTITGSIGVLGGKMVLAGLFEKMGLTFDHVEAGAHAGMFSQTQDFSPSQWGRLQTWLDRVYLDFTRKVAKGRKLTREQVHRIARGRIWTGEDAKRLGLVDELGGLATALALAKRLAGLAEGEEVELRLYPRPRKAPFEDFLEMIQPAGPDKSEEASASEAVRGLLLSIQPLLRQLQLVTEAPGERALAAPQVTIW
jgi:protease-4